MTAPPRLACESESVILIIAMPINRAARKKFLFMDATNLSLRRFTARNFLHFSEFFCGRKSGLTFPGLSIANTFLISDLKMLSELEAWASLSGAP
jgi:hypothetical protein